MANRIAQTVLTGALIALSTLAGAQEQADPRGPLPVPSSAPTAFIPSARGPGQQEPATGFLSSGYRSMHFNSSFTGPFSFPFHVTADGDNLFVSDATGNVVKMYQIINGGITFVRDFGAAGSGPGQFNGPEQVAVVGNDVFIADFNNNRVQRFNRSTGAYVSQFGAPGSGAGQLSNPSGLVFNPANSLLYVSEVGNDRISAFTTSGAFAGLFAAPGSGNGQLNNPYVLAVDTSGNIYAADSVNNRVSKFSAGGTWIRHLAVGVTTPLGLTVDRANLMWVSSGTGDVYTYDSLGNYVSYYYGTNATAAEGYFTGVRGIAVTAPLNVAPFNGAPAIAIVDSGALNVQLYSRTTQPIAHPPINSITGLGSYQGQFAFDSAENVYFASFNSNVVYKYNKFGAFITQWGSAGTGNGQFNGPEGVAVDDSGNVYVADRNNNRIQKFDGNGGYITQWGTFGTGNGQFNHPADIAVDGSWLYVTEEGGNRVQKFSFTGAYVRQWGTAGTGNGQFNTPIGIVVDRNRNQVYVSEYGNSRIQQFSVFGDFIKVIADSTAGTGMLNTPLGLATDQKGNLYSADFGNGRVVQYNDNGTYLSNFAAVSANGIGVDTRNGQVWVGTVGGGVVNRFGAVIGKNDTVGVYRPSNQTFYLRNANSAGAPTITATVLLANSADLPITGDWNGDGIDTAGIYRPSNGTFYLWDRWSGLSVGAPDYTVVTGIAGDRPLSGDWDGEGKDGYGLYRPSAGVSYFKNQLVAGTADYAVGFGTATDTGVPGDWNLDGATSVGVFRPGDARFHVSNRNVSAVVAEDASYPLGAATSLAFAGDWTHSGYSALGVFDPGSEIFTLKYNLDESAADASFFFGGNEMFRDGFENTAPPANGELFPLGGNWGSPTE